jgi:hypothetical protein
MNGVAGIGGGGSGCPSRRSQRIPPQGGEPGDARAARPLVLAPPRRDRQSHLWQARAPLDAQATALNCQGISTLPRSAAKFRRPDRRAKARLDRARQQVDADVADLRNRTRSAMERLTRPSISTPGSALA